MGIAFFVLSLLVVGISIHFYTKYENIWKEDPISKVESVTDINILKKDLKKFIEHDRTSMQSWSFMFLLTGLVLLLSSIYIINVYLALRYNPNKAVK